MPADDPPGARAHRAGRQHVFVGLDGQDLAAHQARHAHPVQHAEHHEQRDHVGAHLGQRRALEGVAQHLGQHHGQQHHHQRVGQGVDDVDDAHHHHVHLPAEIAGYGAVEQADHQHDQTGEQAHRQRHPRAVEHADEVVAAQLVGAEDVGEDLCAVLHVLQFVLGILERGQVLGGLVALAVDGDHLLVAVGIEHRHDDDGQHQADEHHQANHGQRVLAQLAHAVAEERGGFAHGLVLRLFLVGCPLELFQVDLHAEEVFLRELVRVIGHGLSLLVVSRM